MELEAGGRGRSNGLIVQVDQKSAFYYKGGIKLELVSLLQGKFVKPGLWAHVKSWYKLNTETGSGGIVMFETNQPLKRVI